MQKHNTTTMTPTTILFKFRHQAMSSSLSPSSSTSMSTRWSSISFAGSYPRIFDIKRAIVRKSGLGRGKSCDFDFIIRNAMTGELYDDELMRLRVAQTQWEQGNNRDDKKEGVKSLIVERVPAARGQGLLVRFARMDAGLNFKSMKKYGNPDAANRGFYDYRIIDEDEFVDVDVDVRQVVKMPLMVVNDKNGKDNSYRGNISTENNNSNISDQLAAVTPVSVCVDVDHGTSNNVFPSTSFKQQEHVKEICPNPDPELQGKAPGRVLTRGLPKQFYSRSAYSSSDEDERSWESFDSSSSSDENETDDSENSDSRDESDK